MPRYVYECESCNKIFEVAHSIADCDSDIECKYCEKAMKRLILVAPAVHWRD